MYYDLSKTLYIFLLHSPLNNSVTAFNITTVIFIHIHRKRLVCQNCYNPFPFTIIFLCTPRNPVIKYR